MESQGQAGIPKILAVTSCRFKPKYTSTRRYSFGRRDVDKFLVSDKKIVPPLDGGFTDSYVIFIFGHST